jgi:hypothetical protein
MSYTAAIDSIDQGQWHRLLHEFDSGTAASRAPRLWRTPLPPFAKNIRCEGVCVGVFVGGITTPPMIFGQSCRMELFVNKRNIARQVAFQIPLACAMVSALGNRAFYLHGANGNAGLEARAGDFLQWMIVRWLKEQGRCRWYDRGAMASPGVRHFKKGVVGGKAPEIPMIELQTRGSHLSAAVVAAGSRLYEAGRTAREQLERLHRRR